jgi:TatD DNase family protein
VLGASPQHAASYQRQKDVFGMVLRACQTQSGRVVTIHSRRAADDVISMIEKYTTPDRVLTILHWFSGSAASAKRAVAAGCYFSVNGAMLGNDKGRALVRRLPQDRLLTETDSPFTSVGSRNSLPWDVIDTVEGLAVELGTAGTGMQNLLRDNSERVMRFAGVFAA